MAKVVNKICATQKMSPIAAKSFRAAAISLGLLWGLASYGQAYTVVTTSPQASTGLEKEFIASATNQYQATVITNPFVANTYSIQLIGKNPNFNPPPTNKDLLNALVTVDSWTYTAGWANGESYQQYIDIGVVSHYSSLCSTPSAFTLTQASSTTFDAKTCQDALVTILNTLFQESASTPTVVPGGF